MDFTFSDEQEMLRTSVREVMASRYPIERIAAIADGDGFDRTEWKVAADAGWTAISVPEAEGGAGLGFVEEMLVAEELGRALYPGPFLASCVMALPLLRAGAAGGLARSVAGGERIATVAFAEPTGFSAAGANGPVSGSWSFVPNLDVADLIVVTGDAGAGRTAWAVDVSRDADAETGTVRRSGMPALDGTRPLGAATLDGASATPISVDGSTIARVRDRALVALAAEACGAAGRALELAVAYAKQRTQFGRPIGSFQAVSHELARAYMDLEMARSLTYWAAWAVDTDDPEAPTAAAAAKARAAEAAVLTCERAIQAHGGVGFTWEHSLHRYYRRALSVAATLEPVDGSWSRVADGMVGPVTGAGRGAA